MRDALLEIAGREQEYLVRCWRCNTFIGRPGRKCHRQDCGCEVSLNIVDREISQYLYTHDYDMPNYHWFTALAAHILMEDDERMLRLEEEEKQRLAMPQQTSSANPYRPGPHQLPSGYRNFPPPPSHFSASG